MILFIVFLYFSIVYKTGFLLSKVCLRTFFDYSKDNFNKQKKKSINDMHVAISDIKIDF